MQTKKPITIQDVAAELGMHKSTVSLALSGKGTIAPDTRVRVVETARRLGYEPNPIAQRLANGVSATMVCIVSGSLDAGLTTEKILMIQRLLNESAMEAPIYTCDDLQDDDGIRQAAQVRQIVRQRPRGIVCGTSRLHSAVFKELDTFLRSGGVVVTYDSPVPLRCDQVVFDRVDNAYRAAKTVIAAGHRKIGIGFTRTPNHSEHLGEPQSQRLEGFRRALDESGIPVREDWFFSTTAYERGGAEMARRFLAMSERPTAVCIVNDYVAFAFMVELLRAGVRVPEEVSIIGHDNQAIAEYCPVPLTAMAQPIDQITETVVATLLSRVRMPSSDLPIEPHTIVLKGELFERASVVAPPKET